MITAENTGAALVGRVLDKDRSMARVKITNATIYGGGKSARVGEILTLDAREARALFAAQKAVPCAEEPEKPVTREPEEPIVDDPEE